jgi:hypothetical protein
MFRRPSLSAPGWVTNALRPGITVLNDGMRPHFVQARVLLGVLLGVLLLALPAPAARNKAGATLTIRLISTAGHITYRDRAPKGRSKGDTLSGPSTLRNAVKQFGRAKGAVVGHDYEVITLASANVGTVTAKVYLPGGTLRVRGRWTYGGSALTVPVVGGTGRYANARGTSYVRDLSGNRSLNVYRLRIP